MKIANSKIIGILGGYGPYATNDFFKQILDNTEAEKDWEHLHIIIDNNPKIPSRVRAYLFNEPSPLPYMKEGINRLKNAGCDFFVTPCNSAHYFLRDNKESLDLPMLDMVELTIKHIENNNIKRIGLLGSEVTVLSKMYEDSLTKKGIYVENVKDLQDVRFIIEAAKLNRKIEEAKKILLKQFHYFIDKKMEAVIYGCTELPIIIPQQLSPIPVFDSSLILAQETIKYANKIY